MKEKSNRKVRNRVFNTCCAARGSDIPILEGTKSVSDEPEGVRFKLGFWEDAMDQVGMPIDEYQAATYRVPARLNA